MRQRCGAGELGRWGVEEERKIKCDECGRQRSAGRRWWLIEAWVGNDGTVVVRLMQISVEEEREWGERHGEEMKQRRREIRINERIKMSKIIKSSVNAQTKFFIFYFYLLAIVHNA